MTRVQKPAGEPSTAASTFRIDSGPSGAGEARLILAHGAGAGITSAFLKAMADLLATRDIAFTLFEFGYMASRREGGKKRPPPRAEALVAEYRDIVGSLRNKHRRQKLFIGGKSMGGRVASLIADELYEQNEISGLVCLGYPFHPPARPEQRRTEHLIHLRCPALIIQGERDPFGSRAEIEQMRLSTQIAFAWMSDGDHDFGPRGSSGFSRKDNLAAAADAIAAFVTRLSAAR